jgi:O6-methylguanine-DNA--protein-cysteine methyltransferase
MLYDIMNTDLGRLLVAHDGRGISRIHFLDSRKPRPGMEGWQQTGEDPLLNEAKRQLRAYFSGALKEFSLPLSLEGTPFQMRVWNALITIPYGTTWSYKELATAVGNPSACRAVGNANSKNKVSIIAA